MQLHWHRRILQPDPNPALSAAFRAANRNEGSVVSLFVLDDDILAHADALRVAFMLGSLRTLRDWYQTHGSDLLLRYGDPTDILETTVAAVGADKIHWNEDHSQLAKRRDRAVKRRLSKSGIAYNSVAETSSTGLLSSSQPAFDPADRLVHPQSFELEPNEIPPLSNLAEHESESPLLEAGSDTAQKRLQAMLDGRTYRRIDEPMRSK